MFNNIHLRPRLTKDLLKLLANKVSYPIQKLNIIPFSQIQVIRAMAEDDPVRALNELADVLSKLRQEM